ncbi:MAG: DUF2339 domain-containing protein [Elusimicrobiaceae bacterium]|nr:DUF2339 domain-containing protein [Elusimicrobiaceae bacterium]
MEILAIIFFIWLIVLHVKINGLKCKMEELLSSNKTPENNKTNQEQTDKKLITDSQKNTQVQRPQTINASLSGADYLEQALKVNYKKESTSKVENTATEVAQQEFKNYETKTFKPTIQKETSTPVFEFTAAKLFSWIGGFMLFLGVAFCIKYSIEHSLISPAMRIVLGICLGAGLAVWGFLIKNEKYRITSHTLLGSGFAIIYISTYCAYLLYHFISLETSFILMAITSFAAICVSLKKNAKYVGYLGAIIAFLTPILLNSGKDSWAIFFSYVFFINISSAFAAVKKKWNDLFICTLYFTWLCQAIWFSPFNSYKLLGVITFFSLYALASAWLIRKQEEKSILSKAVGIFLCMELLLMLPVSSQVSQIIASSQFLGYVLLVNFIILFLVGRRNLIMLFSKIGKVLSFLILFAWFAKNANAVPLWFSLGISVLFTALNASSDLLSVFNHNENKKPDMLSAFYPLAIITMFLIVFISHGWYNSLNNFGIIFITMNIFLAGLIVLGVLAEMLWIAFLAIAVIFLLLFITIFGLSSEIFAPWAIISSFVPLFICGGLLYILRKKGLVKGLSFHEKLLSITNALMPFLFVLLIVAQTKAPANLHLLLGTTMIICLLNILVARLYQNTYNLPVIAVGSGFVEFAIWESSLVTDTTLIPFTSWALALFALFIIVPFINKKYFWERSSTWIMTSFAGLLFLGIGYLIINKYAEWMAAGIIPLCLLGIYSYLLYLLWGKEKQMRGNPTSIAFISGACLFFLTIIFPIEIKSHWLAAAWILEALFLIYLNKELPYKGWQIVSGGLGIIVGLWAIVGIKRLSPVPTTHIWNWYLWIYGICALCFGAIAYLWEKPVQLKNIFYLLCGLTLFWLVNIEIAQWFNSGNTLVFTFTGHLAEALTYTLAWALFGSAVIGIGLFKDRPIISKIGIGIMVLPLIKFLCSDIWQLELLYRILGSFALAIILIFVSFWYQKRQKVN